MIWTNAQGPQNLYYFDSRITYELDMWYSPGIMERVVFGWREPKGWALRCVAMRFWSTYRQYSFDTCHQGRWLTFPHDVSLNPPLGSPRRSFRIVNHFRLAYFVLKKKNNYLSPSQMTSPPVRNQQLERSIAGPNDWDPSNEFAWPIPRCININLHRQD